MFEPQWNKARNLLSKCKRLAIVGYSFPTTDFYSKKLLLETTSENNIEELIIINPDDEAINYTKNIVPSKKTQIFSSLREYLADSSIDSK